MKLPNTNEMWYDFILETQSAWPLEIVLTPYTHHSAYVRLRGYRVKLLVHRKSKLREQISLTEKTRMGK